MPPELDELRAWIALTAPGIRRRDARQLLERRPCPVSVVREVAQCGSLDGHALPSAFVARLRQAWTDAGESAERTLAWIAAGPHRHVLTLGSMHYPASLLHTPDPPLVLYAQGRLDHLAKPAAAVVGSRSASPLGLRLTAEWAGAWSNWGLCIVSGLALGVDAAAHRSALQATGSTIGVLGCGLDQVYPQRHAELADRVAQEGLLLSEYTLTTPPVKHHFPDRNRIIAGLSLAVVVVEAALQSGSLITARHAVEAGREVLAVPGAIHARHSEGCHWLIKQGAALLDRPEDLLYALPDVEGSLPGIDWAHHRGASAGPGVRSPGGPRDQHRRRNVPRAAPPQERLHSGHANRQLALSPDPALGIPPTPPWLIRELSAGPRSLPDLLERVVALGIDVSQCQSALLNAECDGRIGRLADGSFQWLG